MLAFVRTYVRATEARTPSPRISRGRIRADSQSVSEMITPTPTAITIPASPALRSLKPEPPSEQSLQARVSITPATSPAQTAQSNAVQQPHPSEDSSTSLASNRVLLWSKGSDGLPPLDHLLFLNVSGSRQVTADQVPPC